MMVRTSGVISSNGIGSILGMCRKPPSISELFPEDLVRMVTWLL
jgi:hypothetical protein